MANFFLLYGTEDVLIEDLIPVGNVAFGLAWSYYYGYLNLVLPGKYCGCQTHYVHLI